MSPNYSTARRCSGASVSRPEDPAGSTVDLLANRVLCAAADVRTAVAGFKYVRDGKRRCDSIT